MKQLLVAAHSGQKCPRETGGYITETPVPVPANRYYDRLIKDGSLIVITGASREQRSEQTVTKTKKREEAVNDNSK